MFDIPQEIQELLLEDDAEELRKRILETPDLKHACLRMAAVMGLSGCAKVLADSEMDVLWEDHQSWTPLHHASQGGHVEVLQVLLSQLKHDSSVDIKTEDVRISRMQHLCGGMTPLHLSAGSGSPACVKLLLHAKSDPSLADNNGWIVADHAKDKRAVIDILGMSPQSALSMQDYELLTRRRNEQRMANITPASFQTLLEELAQDNPKPFRAFLLGSDTKNIRIEGNTLLQAAIGVLSPEAITIILEFLKSQGKPGHDPEAAKLLPLPTLQDHDSAGITPLHSTAELGSLECMTLLLDGKADVNIKTLDAKVGVGQTTKIYNEGGRTALHIAVEKGSLEIVECLTRYGANVFDSNSFGISPRQLALERVTLTRETSPTRHSNAIAIAKCLGCSEDDVVAAERKEKNDIVGDRHLRQKKLQERIHEVEKQKDAAARAEMRERVANNYDPLDKNIVSGLLGPEGCDIVAWETVPSATFSRALTRTGSRFTGVEEPFHGVFVFDLLSTNLCARIWEETENYLSVAEDRCLPQPVRHDGCLDLSHVFPDLLARIAEAAMPAIHSLLPPQLHDVYLEHAFRTKNFVGREESFKRHVDKYAVTLNVCLRKTCDVAGSGVFFYEDQSSADYAYRHEHAVGLAVLHSSKEWHQTEPLIAGERGSVIMWFSHR